MRGTKADLELSQLEHNSSIQRKNAMLLPWRISQATSIVAWTFVIGGILLNSWTDYDSWDCGGHEFAMQWCFDRLVLWRTCVAWFWRALRSNRLLVRFLLRQWGVPTLDFWCRALDWNRCHYHCLVALLGQSILYGRRLEITRLTSRSCLLVLTLVDRTWVHWIGERWFLEVEFCWWRWILLCFLADWSRVPLARWDNLSCILPRWKGRIGYEAILLV